MLATGELWPSQRILAEEGKDVPGQTPMENVEHLGQYVYEMTKSKVQQIRAERGLEEIELGVPAPGEGLPTGGPDDTSMEEIEEAFEAEEDK